ncbi:MAG: MFS transporter [Acetobacteraceae bacterium]
MDPIAQAEPAAAGRGALAAFRAMPLAPLLATLAVQTFATMALFSVPTAAPAIARDLAVPGSMIGMFVSLVYGVGIVSALLSPGFVHRYGAVRVTQITLVAVLAMLATGTADGVAGLALGAVVLGLAYGAIAPASTHLLVPQTPRAVFNLVMSLRQIGVPLGGVLGALFIPPLVLHFGWRGALRWEALPVALLLVGLQPARRAWDTDRDPTWKLGGGALMQPLRLIREDAALRRLSVASFVYSGVQLCFIAFMTVQLTAEVRVGLVQAGLALALYQVAGSASRPVWGWVADRFMAPGRLLAWLGIAMAAAALATGRFGPGWPWAAVLAVAVFAGATASGFTGVAYAEYARLGGARRTEATGLGTAAMFAGVMLMPSAFGAAVTALGGWFLPYAGLAAVSGLAAWAVW